MRRLLAAISLLVASLAAPLLLPTTAGAIHPTWEIALNPSTPDPTQALQVSGSCPDSGINPGQVHLRIFDIVRADNAWEIDPLTNADGSFEGTFPANWTDTPGWYQVVTSCPGVSVTVGYAASPVFQVALGTTPQSVPFSATPVTADVDHVVVSGSGCTSGSVRYRVFDGALTELYANTVIPDGQGNWTDDANLNFQDTPVDANRIFYGECGQGEGTASVLYSSTNDVVTPVTDPTTPTTTVTSNTTSTLPGAAGPAAEPAAAVAADPTYTG